MKQARMVSLIAACLLLLLWTPQDIASTANRAGSGSTQAWLLSKPLMTRGMASWSEDPSPHPWSPKTRDMSRKASLVRRRMQAAGESCAGVSCPDTSSCHVLQGGAPACVCPQQTPHWVDNKCSSSLQHSDYLDPHNNARTALGIGTLVWNDTLAAVAMAWAQTLSSNCSNLTHGGLYGPNGERLGQNLAAEFGFKGLDNTWPTYAWIAELPFYTYSPVGSPAACQAGQMCGHYTQVMWSGSKSVGCAMTSCTWPGLGIGLLWACDYFPPGNVVGQYPFDKSALYKKSR